MNIWSIIIAAVIFLLPSLLPSKKNAGKKTASAVPPVSEGTPSMADLFEEEDTEEYEEEVIDADDLGQPVFSYESVANSKPIVDELVRDSKAEAAEEQEKEIFAESKTADSMSVMSLGEDFDLRKAIIYQTIMQRVSA